MVFIIKLVNFTMLARGLDPSNLASCSRLLHARSIQLPVFVRIKHCKSMGTLGGDFPLILLSRLRLVVYPIIYRVWGYLSGGDRWISEASTV